MLWSFIRRLTRDAPSVTDSEAGGAMLAMGIESFNSGDFAAASRQLGEAHAAAPDDADVMYYLALTEARRGNFEHAEEMLEQVRNERDDADVNNALANVNLLRGNLDKAVASYRRALAADGRHLAAMANLGLALRDQGVPDQALPVLDGALALAPDYVEALFNKALVLTDLGASVAADDLIERVLQLDPEFAQAHLQRGFSLLKRGDFAAGWREYAWRVRIPDLDQWQDYEYPLWQGESLTGKRVLVQAEQGLGDQIMFASCLPDLLAAARHTVVECDPRLAKLFARSFPSATIYRHRVQFPPDWSCEPVPDYRMRMGDMPRILRNQDADFPRHRGYLVAEPTQSADWRAQLAALGAGLKVGVSWRGGTPGTGQARRSLPLAALSSVLSVPGAHFISLQYGAVDDEVAEFRTCHGVELHRGPQSHAGMDNIAALIASLDLIITVCTTTAHLSGALGKPTWVMVPTVAEWRYLETGASIPWYPALRLFRQQIPDEWAAVVAKIRLELMDKLAARER